MIKAVLIDDERPALKLLAHLLESYAHIEVAGMFTNPQQGIEKTASIKPQVVFLDIDMPQLMGIDAASRILDQCPETDVVFVTAYNQYAVEAYELYALDYLLKPVSKERLDKTIQRIMAKNEAGPNSAAPGSFPTLQIKCLGRLQVGWEGGEPLKWRTEKTRELFAFLLHNRGRELAKSEIIDAIWPEVEAGRAAHQLHNAVYYIRKTLQKYGIEREQIAIDGAYCLRLGEPIELDVELFNNLALQSETAPNAACCEAALTQYGGEYFAGGDWPWAGLEREKLARQYWQVVHSLTEIHIAGREYEKAEHLLKRAYDNNPFEEWTSLLLMGLYASTGEKARAKKHYLEYSQLLEKELGINPGASIRRLQSELQGS